MTSIGPIGNSIGSLHQEVLKRAEQNLQWMWQLTDELLRQQLTDHSGVGEIMPVLREKVGRGELTPVTAATQIIQRLRAE